jgi:hypothetical protein
MNDTFADFGKTNPEINNEVLYDSSTDQFFGVLNENPKLESTDNPSQPAGLSDSLDEMDLAEKRLVIAKRTRPNFHGKNLFQRLKDKVGHKLQSLKNPFGTFHHFLQSPFKASSDDSAIISSLALTVLGTAKKFSRYLGNDLTHAINTLFDKNLSELLTSADLDDFKNGIIKVQEQIGRSKLILAVLLYAIHKDWKNIKYRYGAESLLEVIESLPEQYRMSRQSFHNAVKAGRVLVHYSFICPGASPKDPSPENEELVKCLVNNYSKLPYIANWLSQSHYYLYPISNEELILHLRDDTVIAFKIFIDLHIQKKIDDEPKHNAQDKKKKTEEQSLPDLTSEQKTICHEIAKGRYIHIVRSDPNDPHFAPSVKKAIYASFTERNKRYRASNFDMLDFAADTGCLPIDFVRKVKAIWHCAYSFPLQLEDLRGLLVKECTTLNQLRIAQAIIVFRFRWDPDIQRACCQGLSPVSLAKKYLGVDDSSYKSLLRISESLLYLPHLQEAGIDPLVNGCLDKLVNFKRALKKRGIDEVLVAFKKCNVREFRHFAKTGYLPDSIVSDNKLLLKGYERAKPILEELDQMRNKGWEVFPVSLYCRYDVELVEKIISEYRNNRAEVIKELMLPSPSLPMLPDMANPLQSDSFEVDVFC